MANTMETVVTEAAKDMMGRLGLDPEDTEWKPTPGDVAAIPIACMGLRVVGMFERYTVKWAIGMRGCLGANKIDREAKRMMGIIDRMAEAMEPK